MVYGWELGTLMQSEVIWYDGAETWFLKESALSHLQRYAGVIAYDHAQAKRKALVDLPKIGRSFKEVWGCQKMTEFEVDLKRV